MGKNVFRAAAVAVAFVVMNSGPAIAQVVDFESIFFVPFGPYDIHEDGFVITTPPGSNPVGAPIACFPTCISSGSKAIYALDGGTFSFKREDGQPFSLISIDAAPIYLNYSLTLELNFAGTLAAGGVISQTIIDPARNSFRSYFLDQSFANVTQVTLTGGAAGLSKFFTFDNVVFGEAVPSAIPEPTSWAMMVIGLAAAGAALRRRVVAAESRG